MRLDFLFAFIPIITTSDTIYRCYSNSLTSKTVINPSIQKDLVNRERMIRLLIYNDIHGFLPIKSPFSSESPEASGGERKKL
jgi:hypothetical protein